MLICSGRAAPGALFRFGERVRFAPTTATRACVSNTEIRRPLLRDLPTRANPPHVNRWFSIDEASAGRRFSIFTFADHAHLGADRGLSKAAVARPGAAR